MIFLQTGPAGDVVAFDKKKYAFSTKNNATKEIVSWGRDYDSLAGSMRSAGQLTDNVTEARLLQNRIMEMSRERYKYITQADFNKKSFLTSQQRKTRLMPQLLHGVDVAYWLSKKMGRHVPVFSADAAGNARFALLDRLQKQGEKCKDFDEEEENPFALPPPRPIPTQPQIPEFYRIRLKEQEEAELAKATFPTQPVLRPLTQKSVTCNAIEKKTLKLPEVTQPASSTPLLRQKTMPPSTPERKARLTRRAQTSKEYSSMRSVEDPRYRTLESSLCNQYTQPEELESERLHSIIKGHDSLHIPSRASVSARPKLQKTILEYLRARGFTV